MSTEYILQSAVNFPVYLWMTAPPFAYQGCKSGTFKLSLYSEDNNDHRIDLYSQGSRSMPWQTPQNKWSHLNPQWRFTDLSGNIINSITLTNATSTTVNGATGYSSTAEFYYIDDMPSELCGTILIWAVADFSQYPAYLDDNTISQRVSSYTNSKVIAAVSYLINQLTPSSLSITRDGINPMLGFYWKDTQIPYVVSVIGTTEADSSSAVMKDVPYSNIYGVSGGSVIRSMSAILSSELTWTPDNSSAFLSAIDYQNFNVGGYLLGEVQSNNTANECTILASVSSYYKEIPIQIPYLWISNPENNSLNRIYAPCINEDMISEEISYLTNLKETVYDVTYLQVSALTNSMGVTGFNGIYGIAIDELKQVWCADIESDKVYKFSTEGVILSTISFDQGGTPAGISIDSLNNVWVTFFDTASVVHINGTNGTIMNVITAGNPFAALSSIDPLFKPILAETDMNNNIWVTYSNTICSNLTKYSSTGILITTITLPTCSNPMDIHITKDNDVWVSLNHHSGPPYGMSSVNKYSGTTYNLLSAIETLNPVYLTMDSEDNLYFTNRGNILTRVSPVSISDWSVGENVSPEDFPLDNEDIFKDHALGGVCCDVYDNVYIINSIDNCIYKLVNETIELAIKVTPDNNLEWYNDTGFIYSVAAEGNKSARAFGDWCGNRWIRKYISTDLYSDQFVKPTYLTGISNQFDISDFSGLTFRRFNESWDASNVVKSFARSPHIADNPTLWDGYMKAVWGDASSSDGTGFGRESYEKISNFVGNHSDINTCNVDQLYNLAQFTDVPIDSYGVNFPPELKRIMDVASVNQQQLWGSRCKCSRNITNTYTTYISSNIEVPTDYICDICGHYHPGNKGQLFNPLTYVVTAFTPFIVEDRSNTNNKYQLITPPSMCSAVPSMLTYDVYAVGGFPPIPSASFGNYCTTFNGQIASGLVGGQTITIITPPKTPGWTSYNFFVEVVPTGMATHYTEPIPSPTPPADCTTHYGYVIPLSGTPNRKMVRSQGHWGYEHAVIFTDLSCNGQFTYPPSSISDTRPNCLAATGSGLNITITLPPSTILPTFNITSDICDLIPTNIVCVTSYPLSSYYNVLLPPIFNLGVSANISDFEQIISYFCFHSYITSYCNKQIAGTINWDDEYTTLNETASSINDWYGSGETLEKIINYVLHTGLGLIGEE